MSSRQSYGNCGAGVCADHETPRILQVFAGFVKFLRFPGNGLVTGGEIRFDAASVQSSFQSERGVGQVWQMVGQRHEGQLRELLLSSESAVCRRRLRARAERSARLTRTGCVRLVSCGSCSARSAGSRSPGRSRRPASRSHFTREHGASPSGAPYMFPAMYWPLIGGFVAFVLFAVLMGWIMDPSPRTARA